MRSRDGDKDISLTIRVTLLLTLFSLASPASEYLISYRYLVKDAILFNETLQIAKAMQKCEGSSYNSLILKARDDKNLKAIISENREEFVEYMHTLGLNVEHHGETQNFHTTSITILTLKTRCFKVDFNDSFVKISALN